MRISPGGGNQKALPVFTTQKAFSLLLAQLPELFTNGLLEQLRLTGDLYVQRITPSEKERDAKRTLFNAFADFLRRAMHDRIAISVAGSTAYEVDAKGSDLDVVLLTNWGAPPYVLQSIVQYLQMTQAVQNNAARSSWPLKNVHLQLVDSARVPVLTVTTPKGLVCDVSVNTLNSVKHTEFFKRVISVNPALRPLMRLLKYWAKVRRLPTMREGGLPGIVWMLLATYFGSCPQSTFLGVVHENSQWHDAEVVSDLYPAIEAMSPLIASLFRLFRLCGSRSSIARTISCTGQYCKRKNMDAVIARVCSQHNFSGVWDEVVSLEDPAITSEPALPANTSWDEPELLPTESSEAAADSTSGGKTSRSFQPGSATDLAAKMSCATWLVYMLELRRGATILSRLFTFINDARTRVRHLPLILTQGVSSSASSSTESSSSSSAAAASSRLYDQSAHDFIARQFRQFVAFLFEESTTDRFVLPGCDEKLRNLAESTTPSGEEAEGRSLLDASWEAPALSARGLNRLVFRPFCTCCSQPRMEFAVVLLHARIHLLRITSICTDWTSWWTRDFLSRRDVRSIIHGTLHEVVFPQTYIPVLELTAAAAQKHAIVDMPATSFPAEQTCQPLPAGVTPYPHLVLPVRKVKDSTPVELLFRPCDFVCRLKAWKIPGYGPENDASVLAEEVFFMEADEVRYLQTLANLAAEAPWHSLGDRFGSSQPGGDVAAAFQPAAFECARCGVDADLMDALPVSAGYECPDGPFQQHQTQRGRTRTCQGAWARWEAHVTATAEKHQEKAPPTAEQTSDLFVVPELQRASHLLAATIEGLQQRLNIPPEQPVTRRTVSLPDRFESKEETADGILRPLIRQQKREELLRYVPPSKRKPARKTADTLRLFWRAAEELGPPTPPPAASHSEETERRRRKRRSSLHHHRSAPVEGECEAVGSEVEFESKAVDEPTRNTKPTRLSSSSKGGRRRFRKQAVDDTGPDSDPPPPPGRPTPPPQSIPVDASRRLLQSALKGTLQRPPPPDPSR